jgi:isopentenyldiphosphate isomerase
MAVFASKSDQLVKIDRDESSFMEFWSKEEVDGIVDAESTSPWLSDAWILFRDSF